MVKVKVYQGDNLKILKRLKSERFGLIYIDPPFNTGHKQRRSTSYSYDDNYANYLDFLAPRLQQAYRLLTPTGSLFVHLDYRELHYTKVALDDIFGRESFINEIIWVYDFGARSKKRWSAKHDTILWYAKSPKDYTFRWQHIDRIPYLAPGLVGPKKAAKGKTPTDVWWQTIVSPTGKEKTGYPTQKPLAIMRRIIRVHSHRNDRVLDFFAGSGTTGVAAAELGRTVTLIDSNPDAIKVIKQRLPQAIMMKRK